MQLGEKIASAGSPWHLDPNTGDDTIEELVAIEELIDDLVDR